MGDKWAPANKISHITKIINPKFRALWQGNLNHFIINPSNTHPRTEFLFYGSSPQYQNIFQGNWDYNAPELSAYVFAQDAGYFLRDWSTRALTTTKKFFLLKLLLPTKFIVPRDKLARKL